MINIKRFTNIWHHKLNQNQEEKTNNNWEFTVYCKDIKMFHPGHDSCLSNVCCFSHRTMRNGVHFCVITTIFHSFVFPDYFDTILKHLNAKSTAFFQANSASLEILFLFYLQISLELGFKSLFVLVWWKKDWQRMHCKI